jgi:hypothetical protein
MTSYFTGNSESNNPYIFSGFCLHVYLFFQEDVDPVTATALVDAMSLQLLWCQQVAVQATVVRCLISIWWMPGLCNSYGVSKLQFKLLLFAA